ncbi:MAG: translation initiation factor IF-2 subunit gamma, partial [Thermoplasmata archaeon]
SKTVFLRSVSFVDAPGHETLMATMLSGAALMNGAILLIAANEPCPQAQTREHLMALEICGIDKIVIVQNKIDLVSEEAARENYRQIKEFVKGTIAEKAPVIPVSAHQNANISSLIHALETVIPTPKLDTSKPPRLYIARSFDVNMPGNRPKDLVGGVVGGSILQGELHQNDEIEISPGRRVEKGSKITYEPILTRATTLISGGKTYESVKPGGLVGVGTNLDPTLTKSDGLTGKVLGRPGTLPPVRETIRMELHLLEHVVGSAANMKVENIQQKEALMLNIGTATTVGIVSSVAKGICTVSLKLPVCGEEGQRIAIGRKIEGKWRLIGYGIIL